MSGPAITYTQPVADEICRRLAQGQTLEAVCADPAMPCMDTVRSWRRRVPGFGAAVERAWALAGRSPRSSHTYRPELAAAVCERVAAGETVKAICADPAMPPAGTVHYWLTRHPDFAEGYRRAWDMRAAAGLGRIAYSEEIADAFCARIAAGELTRKICALPGMPNQASVYEWLTHRPEFVAKYERAREVRRGFDPTYVGYCEAVADEICQRLIDGESMGEICADPTMPAQGTVQAWRRRRPDFGERFEAARKLAIETVEDRMLQIANTVTPETAAADRVRLATLIALAVRLDRTAQKKDWSAPMTIRFVDGPGEDYYDSVEEMDRAREAAG